MTEDEATTKWCPFSRVLEHTYSQQGEFRVSTGYSYNRSPDDEEGYIASSSMCIGSACMAWRWRGWFLDEDRGCHAAPPPDDPSVRLGFCGLAGSHQ